MDFTLLFLKVFFIAITLVAPILIFLSSIVIGLGQIVAKLEKWQRFDALYWSFITATTVGYGDIRPLKRSSKLLSVLIAFTGIMFTGIIVAITLESTQVAIDQHFDQSVLEEIAEQFK